MNSRRLRTAPVLRARAEARSWRSGVIVVCVRSPPSLTRAVSPSPRVLRRRRRRVRDGGDRTHTHANATTGDLDLEAVVRDRPRADRDHRRRPRKVRPPRGFRPRRHAQYDSVDALSPRRLPARPPLRHPLAPLLPRRRHAARLYGPWTRPSGDAPDRTDNVGGTLDRAAWRRREPSIHDARARMPPDESLSCGGALLTRES